MATLTKTHALTMTLIATFAIPVLTPVAALAADPPVTVTNTTSNPVPTVITNIPSAPVPTIITNRTTQPIPVSVGGFVSTVITNGVYAVINNTVAKPVPALITNTSTNPVVTVDVNKPIHTPFSQRLDISFSGGFGNGTFTVPNGKRLVIKYFSCDVGVKVGANALADLATYNAGAEVEAHLPLANNGVILGQQVYSSSQQTTIFADPNSTVTVAFLDSDTTASGGAIVGVYGYLVDANAASYE